MAKKLAPDLPIENGEKSKTDTRFKPGNPGGPGRPPGAKNKLGEAFIEAMAADFEQHGQKAIEVVRAERPHEYLKVIASILPKDVTMTADVSESFLRLWSLISDGAASEMADRMAQEPRQSSDIRH